jgi:hypothetical protein
MGYMGQMYDTIVVLAEAYVLVRQSFYVSSVLIGVVIAELLESTYDGAYVFQQGLYRGSTVWVTTWRVSGDRKRRKGVILLRYCYRLDGVGPIVRLIV